MAGTWTNPPKTWVDGETPTGAQFNTQIRDQLAYLKDAPVFDGSPVVTGTLTATNVNVGASLQVSGSAGVSANLTVAGSTQLGDAIADTVNMVGLIVGAPLRNYTETRVNAPSGGGGVAIDCALGTYFVCPLTEPVGMAIYNPPPAGRVLGITCMFIGQGVTAYVNFPTSVRWPGGAAPVLTTVANKVDIVTLITEDGGANWYGVIVGQGF